MKSTIRPSDDDSRCGAGFDFWAVVAENGKHEEFRRFLIPLIGAELGLLAPLSPHRLLSAHQILLVVVVLLLFLTLVRPIVV